MILLEFLIMLATGAPILVCLILYATAKENIKKILESPLCTHNGI